MFFLLRTSQFQAAIDARDRKMQFDVKKTRTRGTVTRKPKEFWFYCSFGCWHDVYSVRGLCSFISPTDRRRDGLMGGWIDVWMDGRLD